MNTEMTGVGQPVGGGVLGAASVQFYELRNGVVDARISNYGARLVALNYKGRDIVYGPKTPQGLLSDTCYCGAVCGRVANRIAGAEFTLDGHPYKLFANDGCNHLHGGKVGFSHRLWRVEEFREAECLSLSLVSPVGEEGYPGQVTVRLTYSIHGARLELRVTATTTEKTLLNLTNHVYWNMRGSGTIDDHLLSVDAEEYTPMLDHIPTGERKHVVHTPYDLRRGVTLGALYREMGAGLDDNYVLSDAPAGGVRTAARLSYDGVGLELSTDAPGLQVYTGDGLSPLPRGGIALEPQAWPDAPHKPHFPSITLAPGQTYERFISWTFC